MAKSDLPLFVKNTPGLYIAIFASNIYSAILDLQCLIPEILKRPNAKKPNAPIAVDQKKITNVEAKFRAMVTAVRSHSFGFIIRVIMTIFSIYYRELLEFARRNTTADEEWEAFSRQSGLNKTYNACDVPSSDLDIANGLGAAKAEGDDDCQEPYDSGADNEDDDDCQEPYDSGADNEDDDNFFSCASEDDEEQQTLTS